MRFRSVYSALVGLAALLCLSPVSYALTEGFDSVSPPALPLNWTTSKIGAGLLWQTTSIYSLSEPNSLILGSSSSTGESTVTSPSFLVPTLPAQVEFRQSYYLERGFDGGVLELQIGAGPFIDILAAGGSFVSGGYTRVISSCCSNPLSGRSAWTGNSGGFIRTIIDLPSSVAGQSIALRWRAGFDLSNSGTGWSIDAFSLRSGLNQSDLSINVVAQAAAATEGQPFNYVVELTNLGPNSSSPIALHQQLPANVLNVSALASSGQSTIANGLIKFQLDPIASTSTIIEQTNLAPHFNPQGETLLTIGSPAQIARDYLARSTGFSPSLIGASVSSDLVMVEDSAGDPSDGCDSYQGSFAFGKIVLIDRGSSCSPTTQVKIAQDFGAVAAVIVNNQSSSTFEGDELPTLVGSDPAITIRSVLIGYSDGVTLKSALYQGVSATLNSVTDLLVTSFVAQSDVLDSNLGNNTLVKTTTLLRDSDNDGLADINDGCPTDSAKSAPLSCGCGLPDLDLNRNNVADCLKNAEMRKRVDRAIVYVRNLKTAKTKRERTKQVRLRSSLQDATLDFVNYAKSESANIVLLMPSHNLLNTANRAFKYVKKALKAGPKSLARAKIRAESRLRRVILILAP